MPSASQSELEERIGRLRWWHSHDFGQGIVSKGAKSVSCLQHEASLAFDRSVEGKSVIDVGAWDGFFSFEAKRRGASRVLATDHFCWSGAGWGTKEGFDLARETLDLEIEDRDIDPMDINRDTVGTFDVVLFLGVFYHLRHPLFVLERLSQVCNESLILETCLEPSFSKRPKMFFYPGSELSRDNTNWWGPNRWAVEAMLKDVGFKNVEYKQSVGFPKPPRAFFHASK